MFQAGGLAGSFQRAQAGQTAVRPVYSPFLNMKKILLLDDNIEVVVLYKTLVGRLGHTVRTSSKPEEALKMVETENFDLIITDLKMPGMGGVEFIERVRGLGSKAKIVVITGYPTLQDAQKFNKFNVYKCLIKPVLIKTLEQTIEAALAEPAPDAKPAASGAPV